MAASAFTFDGTDLSTYGLQVGHFASPVTGDPVVETTGSPAGGYRFEGSGYGPNTVSLPCYVEGSSTSDLRSKLDSIAGLLDVRNHAKKLTLDAIANRYWTAICASRIPPDNGHELWAEFTLTFHLEGHAYASTATTGSETIATDPDTFQITSPAGNVEATCIHYVRNTTGGDVTGTIQVNNLTRSEYIKWIGTLENGRWLRIGSEDSAGRFLFSFDKSTASGADPTVLSYSNVKSGIPTDGGDWVMLTEGVNNDIQISGLSSGSYQYAYRARYLGG